MRLRDSLFHFQLQRFGYGLVWMKQSIKGALKGTKKAPAIPIKIRKVA
jgi:hypothetical protein